MYTPIKPKPSQPQTQTLSPPASTPPRILRMITPNKLNSPPQTHTALFIANTSPEQTQQQQTMGSLQSFTKRRILFTEEIAPPPKRFAMIHNDLPNWTCPTANDNMTIAQTNAPGSMNLSNQERMNLIYNQQQLDGVENNIEEKKVLPTKPTRRKQLKYSRKNDIERARARNESNAIKVLRSNLPPLRVDENNAPVYARKKYDVIKGAITYIKELQRLLNETEVH